MVTSRAGRSNLGCLILLLVASVAVYFGVNIGEVYWRGYQFQDAMKQEARFAAKLPNERITSDLQAVADSLGLPDEASKIRVRRVKGTISIAADYDENVELPMFARAIHFHPRAEGTY
jgi:hypothetical protein